MSTNKKAAEKITAALALLEEAQAMIVDDPHGKNDRIVRLVRIICSRVAVRLDPGAEVREVYPWQRA